MVEDQKIILCFITRSTTGGAAIIHCGTALYQTPAHCSYLGSLSCPDVNSFTYSRCFLSDIHLNDQTCWAGFYGHLDHLKPSISFISGVLRTYYHSGSTQRNELASSVVDVDYLTDTSHKNILSLSSHVRLFLSLRSVNKRLVTDRCFATFLPLTLSVNAQKETENKKNITRHQCEASIDTGKSRFWMFFGARTWVWREKQAIQSSTTTEGH